MQIPHQPLLGSTGSRSFLELREGRVFTEQSLMKVRLLPEAEMEFLEAAQWYREQSLGLDYEFVRCIVQCCAEDCNA